MDRDRERVVVGSALRERLGGFTRGVSLSERIRLIDVREQDRVSVELESAMAVDDELG